ncbi:fatty acid--CoA ligase family protein [Yoonia sp. GPGPB17]|uniref:class I adenylate-forming enzyme family protein n=1 Tax=Yoonia sp. GPGPB17 TaxID=3026147 RepID=UPI0030C31D19
MSLFAVWKCGACAVMVNPAIKAGERQNVIATTGAALWLDDNSMKELPPQAEHLYDIDGAALILMTSGTTGTPKGVTHSIDGLRQRLAANLTAIGPTVMKNTLCTLPLFFGHGLIGNALTALYAGQHLWLLPKIEIPQMSNFGATLDQHEITFFSSVPSFWKMILATSPPPQGAMQRVHVGSAPLSLALWESIANWCGTKAVFNSYGMTETANWISGGAFSDVGRSDGYVGQPWGGEFRVLRDNGLHSHGEGQVAVKSPGQMLGFWRNPEKTREVMLGDYMLTGDLGHLAKDQSLTLVGRTKNEINVAGIKVLAEEVDMLLEGHAHVAEACSFGIPDPISGQRVAALVRPTSNTLDTMELIAWCRENARTDAVPSKIEFVTEIPKNDRGKIARIEAQKQMVEKWF